MGLVGHHLCWTTAGVVNSIALCDFFVSSRQGIMLVVLMHFIFMNLFIFKCITLTTGQFNTCLIAFLKFDENFLISDIHCCFSSSSRYQSVSQPLSQLVSQPVSQSVGW